MRFDVYLELSPTGACFAHLPSLPGCFARAGDREAALGALPGTIRDYFGWLRRHDEDTPAFAEPVRLVVAETSVGVGPFARGDPAALFTPDRAPLGRDKLERHLRLAGYSRADLLGLVADLPDAALDWRLTPDAMSIHQILRHVGNAEEWYFSRLVPPEALPAEWDGDEALPIFAFLAMERRTVTARLRQLTDAELAEVRYPTGWTAHPDEPWTARKALRRLLEHEREHIDHIGQVLAAWRAGQPRR